MSPEEEAKQKERQVKRNLLLVAICVTGFGLMVGGASKIGPYNEWADAKEGQCIFESSYIEGCTKSRNKKEDCNGYRLVYEYNVFNESDAYDLCSTVTQYQYHTCQCNIEPEDFDLNPPSNADEYQTCTIRECGGINNVYFDGDGSTYTSTNTEYELGIAMVIVGVIFMICSISLFCYYKKKDKREAKVKELNSVIEQSGQSKKECGESETVNGSKIGEGKLGGGDVTVTVDGSTGFELDKWLISMDNKYSVYLELFTKNGFDKKDVIKTMTDDDLKSIGIDKLGHRRKILMKIQDL